MLLVGNAVTANARIFKRGKRRPQVTPLREHPDLSRAREMAKALASRSRHAFDKFWVWAVLASPACSKAGVNYDTGSVTFERIADVNVVFLLS